MQEANDQLAADLERLWNARDTAGLAAVLQGEIDPVLAQLRPAYFAVADDQRPTITDPESRLADQASRIAYAMGVTLRAYLLFVYVDAANRRMAGLLASPDAQLSAGMDAAVAAASARIQEWKLGGDPEPLNLYTGPLFELDAVLQAVDGMTSARPETIVTHIRAAMPLLVEAIAALRACRIAAAGLARSF
ncbi:MAG TPA: hypothetical protein VG755_18310 [Nannocystaceae bacterium]|nr:hypothetical protein [Nannocystaceae bacterium]